MPGSPLDENELGKWRQLISRAEEKQQEQWTARYIAARQWRQGVTEEGPYDHDTVGDATQDRVRINLLQTKHETRRASLVARDPKFFVRAIEEEETPPGQPTKSQINEMTLKYFWEQNDCKQLFRELVADYDDAGGGVLMIDHVNDVEIIPNTAFGDDEETEVPGGDKAKDVDFRHGITRDQINTFRIPPKRIYFDPDEEHNPLDGRFFFAKFKRAAEDILRTAGWKNPKAAEEALKNAKNSVGPDGRYPSPITTVDLIDLWDKTTGMRYTLVDGYWKEPLHWEEWPKGLQNETEVFDLETGQPVEGTRSISYVFPLLIYSPRRDNDSLYPRSDSYDLVGMQRSINKLTRLDYQVAVRSLPRLIGKRGSNTREDVDAFLNSPVLGYTELDRPDEILPITPGSPSPQVQQSRDRLIDLFDLRSGISSFNRGQPAMHKISASEATFIESGSRSLEDYDLDILSDVIKKWAKMILRVYHADGTTPIIVPLDLGPARQTAITIEPGDVQPICQVELKRGGTRYYDRQAQIQEAQAHIAFLQEAFGPSGLINQDALLDIYLDVIGWQHESIKVDVPPEAATILEAIKQELRTGKPVEEVLREAADTLEAAKVDHAKEAAMSELEQEADKQKRTRGILKVLLGSGQGMEQEQPVREAKPGPRSKENAKKT